jgi:cell volume regulation protein A
VKGLDVSFTLGLMLLAGVGAQAVADRLRLPRMLLLLGVGTLLGPSVTGLIDVPLDSQGAHLLLTVGVSLILFYGGLKLSARVLSPVAVGLVLLVIPGVLLTALVTGVVAAAAFAVPISMGVLIGATLAPTDPAILIPLFERLRIRPKISQSVIAESALNDATAAVFALAVAGAVLSGQLSFTHALKEFAGNLFVSCALGIGFGVALAFAEHPAKASIHASAGRVGLARIAAVAAGLGVIAGAYFSIDHVGGSGYMGAFLAGLIAANLRHLTPMRTDEEQEFFEATEFGADVMVLLVFIPMGANLPWRAMAENLLPALAVVATLLLVARPIVIAMCLGLDRRGRWTLRELAFMTWSRETGVMPAALAGIIVGMGVSDSNLVVICVAIAIVITLSLQSTTKPWLARRLSLLDAEDESEAGPRPPDVPEGADLPYPDQSLGLASPLSGPPPVSPDPTVGT